MDTSLDSYALPLWSEAVMLLNTSCWKPQKEKVLLFSGPAHVFPTGITIEQALLISGWSWGRLLFGTLESLCQPRVVKAQLDGPKLWLGSFVYSSHFSYNQTNGIFVLTKDPHAVMNSATCIHSAKKASVCVCVLSWFAEIILIGRGSLCYRPNNLSCTLTSEI